ncbi:hypothetical protein FUAX_18020 [Fulvitalea axinellae]|uniref:Uncharacterized protein n=1 Tax=Fulvitalea axinellae TaxID=1182444 RepID=A0AAU9DEK3_9BACT|nr:hypothetical protein FUAX_18020 [Fulvitalea axinellae]
MSDNDTLFFATPKTNHLSAPVKADSDIWHALWIRFGITDKHTMP